MSTFEPQFSTTWEREDYERQKRGEPPLGPLAQEYIAKAEEHPSLGPNYFLARDVVEKFLDGFDMDRFEPIIKKATDEIYSKLLESVQDYLFSSLDSNLQGELWRGIDRSVQALMTGEQWALNYYALQPKYGDGEKIRQAVAKHIPVELQNARVTDLEAEVERLKGDLAFYQRR